MTIELTMLVYSVALLFLLILIQALSGVLAQGLPEMAGSRDNLPDPKPFQARTKRIVDNHREGLALFAPLVLVAAVAHISNPMTVLGAQLFFYARVVHALLYLAACRGSDRSRGACGIAGTVLVFAPLVGIA